MNRDRFVRLGILVEIGLLIVAAGINLAWPLPPEENPLHVSLGVTTWGAILFGIGSGLLMSLWFGISLATDWAPLKRIQDFVRDELAPLLSQCQHWELVAIAAFAGIGEEVLFRGVLQPRVGWVLATVLFALAHPVTPAYVIIAGVLGGILGLLQMQCGNLWAPIIAHAVYDYIGFYCIIRDYRHSTPSSPAN